MNQHNLHDIDARLDRAIDALNREASPAPHEHGDPELFSLVDTARLARSLRDPAEPDPGFMELAVNRITADLGQPQTTGNRIPPVSPAPTRALPDTDADDTDRPRGIRGWFRDMSELAAILLVGFIVLVGVIVYQTTFSGGDGDAPGSGPGEVATDTEPTSTTSEEPDDSAMQRGLSFEEAQEITSFDLIRPDPLPANLEFIGADVRLASDTTPFDEAYLMYRLVDGEMPVEPIIFRQIDARMEFDHRDAEEITIGSRTVTAFHTAIDDDGVPLAFYAWNEGDVIIRSYTVSARLAGDVTEQHLEDLISALPEVGSNDSDGNDTTPAISELRLEGMLCCGVHGEVDGENYIFALNMDGSIQAVHVDEGGALELIGSLDTPLDILGQTLTGITGIGFEDGVLYVPLPGAEGSGLWIVDVSNPAAPVEMAFVETELPPLSVAVSNGVAVVWPMSFMGPLLIFDVTDPSNPELVSEYEHSVSSMPPAIEFSDSLLYISSNGGVSILDLSNPTEPVEIGTYENPDWEGPSTTGGSGVQVPGEDDRFEFADIALDGDYLYIAANSAGLRVVDVSDPENPQEVTQIELQGWSIGVAATNSGAYVLTMDLTGEDPYTLYTVDMSDASNLQNSTVDHGLAGGLVPSILTVNDTLYFLDFATLRSFDPNSAGVPPD